MTKCDSCRDEVAALRMVKRRLQQAADAASGAGAGLTGRLIGLSALASMADREPADDAAAPPPASPDRPNGQPGRGQVNPGQRAGRYFLTGSLAVFLAGLGTAAFIAGGEPQPQAPTPPVAPSVDVMVFPRGPGNDIGTVAPLARPSSPRPRPAASTGHTSHTRT